MKPLIIKTRGNFFSEVFTIYPFASSYKPNYANLSKDSLDNFLKQDSFLHYSLHKDSKIFAKVDSKEGDYTPIALLRLLSKGNPSKKSYENAITAISNGYNNYLIKNNLDM